MHDPERRAIGQALLVRVMQAGGGRGDDRDDVFERHPRVLAAHQGEQAARILAMHVLHREEVLAILLADIVDLDDVVMVQRCGEPGLVEEHRDIPDVARLLGADALDHDVALEPLEAARARQEDVGHAALGEPLDHLITTEARCLRQRSNGH